ncbi:unnamed protein product [Microthlaspi erraticum]|uniref:Uncharacterized protein n=1 Tax=Microthlaspi erraticum TaxID=1685480 RepID=A0A6D2KXY2_9BRAS|nr:unnamed protein product [Microthlaspi erraticum]
MPIISHDLMKGKGLVFGFEQQSLAFKRNNVGPGMSTTSEPHGPVRLTGLSVSPLDQEGSSSSSPLEPTVFRMGYSSEGFSSGVKSSVSRGRKRPQKWRRLSSSKAIPSVGHVLSLS